MAHSDADDIAEVLRGYAKDAEDKAEKLKQMVESGEIPPDLQKAAEWQKGLAEMFRAGAENVVKMRGK